MLPGSANNKSGLHSRVKWGKCAMGKESVWNSLMVLDSAFRDRHFDWSQLSLSLWIPSTQVFRRSIYAQCVHTVFIWQSLSVLQYFALPNPVQSLPTVHCTMPFPIDHPLVSCALFFEILWGKNKQKRRRWTVDSELKTVNSSGGTRKTVIAIVVVVVVVVAAVF